MDVTPEYLPRLETLLPILAVEEAVWRGDRSFSRQGWQNRTRLRNPDGWQWITVPIERGQRGQSIDDTGIAYHDGWRKRHLKALQYNYSTSPFHEHYAPDIEVLFNAKHETLGQLNRAALELILRWLKHPIRWLDPDIDPIAGSPDATEGPPDLIAPAAGKPSQEFEHPVYRQNYDGFIPGMSALDILFNHGPQALHQLARAL